MRVGPALAPPPRGSTGSGGGRQAGTPLPLTHVNIGGRGGAAGHARAPSVNSHDPCGLRPAAVPAPPVGPRQSTRMQTPGAARRTHTTQVKGVPRPPNKLFGLEAPETQAPRRGRLACSHQQNPEKTNLPPGPVPAPRTGPVGPEPSVDAPFMPGVRDGAACCLGSSGEPGCSHFGRQSPPPGPEAREPRAGAGTTTGAGPAHADVPGLVGSRGGHVRAPARQPPAQQPPSEPARLGLQLCWHRRWEVLGPLPG